MSGIGVIPVMHLVDAPCPLHALVDGRSRPRKVSGGQRPSVAADGVAAGEKAELPGLIEWLGTGSNCRPSAFQDEG